mgnify:CR=1 FL=1
MLVSICSDFIPCSLDALKIGLSGRRRWIVHDVLKTIQDSRSVLDNQGIGILGSTSSGGVENVAALIFIRLSSKSNSCESSDHLWVLFGAQGIQ